MKAVRSWYIDASQPSEKPNGWRRRVQISVLADNVLAALNCFRQAYPEAEVWVIRHEGKRLVLDGGGSVPVDDTQ